MDMTEAKTQQELVISGQGAAETAFETREELGTPHKVRVLDQYPATPHCMQAIPLFR